VTGAELEPYKYLIHMPRIKSGLPIRNGLARLVAVMFMLKSYTLKDWWAFAELFGMPIRVGKYGPNATEDEINTLVNAIANIASDAGAAIPESMQLELIEAAKATGGETLFQNMAEWADSQISKAVLGQTMTADNGSSQSQANVHNEVRGDIQRDDARQLSNTLQTLVKWVIDLNHGPQERYPQIKLPIIEPEDLKALAEALGPMVDRGLKIKASQVRARFGFTDPDDDSELLHPEGQGLPQEPALNHQKLALNRQELDPVEQTLTEIQDDLEDEWEPVIKPILDPIQTLADESEDLEDFIARLPELLEGDEMDATELVKRLAEGTFKARGLGDDGNV
jgi:phage gp29-like protein